MVLSIVNEYYLIFWNGGIINEYLINGDNADIIWYGISFSLTSEKNSKYCKIFLTWQHYESRN